MPDVPLLGKRVEKMRRPGKTECHWCTKPSTYRGMAGTRTLVRGCEFHIKI